MAGEPLFIDSGGFYALMSEKNAMHRQAAGIMEKSRQLKRRAVTTDYVLDETITLLRARGLTSQLKELFRIVETSNALAVEWINKERFAAAQRFLLKRLDQEFSFTDCVSFIVMKESKIFDALATDKHFRIAGFNPLFLE